MRRSSLFHFQGDVARLSIYRPTVFHCTVDDGWTKCAMQCNVWISKDGSIVNIAGWFVVVGPLEVTLVLNRKVQLRLII